MRKLFVINIVILLILLLTLINNSIAENWHQWRGANNDGISNETDVPIQWSQTENVRWKLTLPGEGASTPVVWKDKIFLTSADGNDLVLLCITTDGEEIWKRTLAQGNRTKRGDEVNCAAPSPTTDGKYVWAFFGTGDLACYDFEGNPVWQTNLEERYGKL